MCCLKAGAISAGGNVQNSETLPYLSTMPWFIDRTVSQSSFTLRRLFWLFWPGFCTFITYSFSFVSTTLISLHLLYGLLIQNSVRNKLPSISNCMVIGPIAFADTLIFLIISQIILYSLVHNRHCYAVTVKRSCTWVGTGKSHVGVDLGVTPRSVFSVVRMCILAYLKERQWRWLGLLNDWRCL